ncbi:FAD-binding oxidoreductase [Nocardia wallacei]|uniref:FAD-binding oxidoreductase n=1 Tax=Nocardia wallacei TaxID=480035 RepID=UPI0024559321|nr:FAD-binding oxidoreductase [Nocardia wallacei]
MPTRGIRRPTNFDANRRRFLALGGGLAASVALAACSNDGGSVRADASAGGDLRSVIRGRMLLPGDDGFDQARMPFNLAVDQSVTAVAEVADAADAAALVRYARGARAAISVQPSGHGASGGTNGTILVRTKRLDEVRVDAVARSVRVGAGASWGQLQAAVAPHGLTGLAGSTPAVSVAGYTLGAGMSWFGRKHGWAADSVTAFEVVDAEGNAVRVTADSEPDLFWALRGGGGDFALVTAMELDLYPAPALYGGRMLWPVDRAPQVLEAFRAVTAEAVDELSVWFNLLKPPGAGRPMVGIDAVYLGEVAAGEGLLRRFDGIGGRMSDNRRALPITELGAIAAEPTTPGRAQGHTQLLTRLDDDTVQQLLAKPIDPLLIVQIRHLGGAFAGPSDSPAGAVAEPYQITFQGLPTTPDAAAAIRARVQDYRAALGPRLSSRTPFTFLAPGQSAADAFTPDALARLRGIKRRVDPSGVFRSNYSVLT